MTTAPADRRVFLGQPSYGQVTSGSARAFWRATRLPDSAVYRKHNEGSLLAANFNALWCDALNLLRGGRRLDYFAMIHADVEPEDWWLDMLMDEMESRDLDVLGVIVPIKDRKGITSTALARPDGDTWRPLSRLTMSEVYRLPETFTSEDVGHPILLNTGLWACRFDESWAKQVRFTINDRIVTAPDGQYIPQCEPEDWYFSRLLHELGLKVGATRKVRAIHRGHAAFLNDSAWGQPIDLAWIAESPLPDNPPGAFVLPAIDGWLRHEEGEALARLAKGRRVLEIGSYCGLSTVCMARTADRVVAVDPHDGRGTPIPRDTCDEFFVNLERFGVAGKVIPYRGTSAEAHGAMNGEVFDLAFIDGAHDAENVRRDLAVALARLAPGGLIAFHDYRKFPGQFDGRWDAGVSEVVDGFLASGAELISTHATLAVVRPPSFVPHHPEV